MRAMSRRLLFFAAVVLISAITLTFVLTPASTAQAGNANDPKAAAALVLDSDSADAEESGQTHAEEDNAAEAASGAGRILASQAARPDDGAGRAPIGRMVQQDDSIAEPQADDRNREQSEFVMTNVKTVLNVRQEPSEDAAIIGKLYADCYGQILERSGEWTRITSGNLTGWAKNDYLLFGDEAQQVFDEVARRTATANVSGLRIRKGASADAGIYALLAEGEIVDVYENLGEWLKINYEGYEGYVAAEYVTIDVMYATGETMQEIAAREQAEAEAKRKAQEERAARRAALNEEQQFVEENYSELQLMAALIWCEAGNQPYEGMIAVGAVVMNRVNHPSYPNTITGVIYAPGQFTPVMTGKVIKALERGVPDSCTQAAIEAMSGVNNVGDALHFNTLAIRSSDLIIGAHAFW